MFQFRGFPTYTYLFSMRSMILHHRCSHIRISAGHSLFAAHRSFSQLVTSFVGSQCQGILHMLFFAWTTFVYWSQYTFGSLYAWIAVFFILAVKRHSFSMIAFLWQNCFLPYYGKTWFRYSRLLVFSLYFVCHVLLFSYSVFNEHRLTLVKLQSNLSFLKSLWRSTKISLRYTT